MLGEESRKEFTEGSQTLGTLTVTKDQTRTVTREVRVVVCQEEKARLLQELRDRVKEWEAKTRIEKLPEGNSYCLFCGALCFIVPEKDVETVTINFCADCTHLKELDLI